MNISEEGKLDEDKRSKIARHGINKNKIEKSADLPL